MQRNYKYFISIFCLLVLIGDGNSQNYQLFYGTRPQSMGEAFLAVADDGNTIYWNPAGLARMEQVQVNFAYSNLYNLGLKSYSAGFLSRPYFTSYLTDYFTFGFSWNGLQFSDEENELSIRGIQFGINQFHLALGIKFPDLPILRNLSIGLSAHYFAMDGKLDAAPVIDAGGWGKNWGALYVIDSLKIIPGKLKLGIMVQDLNDTRVTHDNHVSEKILTQNFRYGFCYQPFDHLHLFNAISVKKPLFAIDIDDRIHMGLEFWIGENLAIRGGIQKDRHTDEKFTFSTGLGIRWDLKKWKKFEIDYSLTDAPVLPNTNSNFNWTIIFYDNPRIVRVNNLNVQNVYASLYLNYARKESGLESLKLTNVSKQSIKSWLSLEEGLFNDCQEPDTVIIPGKTTVEIPLCVLFKPNIFAMPGGRQKLNVISSYEYKGEVYSSSQPIEFDLHEKRYLTWDDPAKAAAFVTVDHPLVTFFVDQILNKKSLIDSTQWISKYRIMESILLYNAVKALGVSYQPDPVTPIDSLQGGKYRPDIIRYPTDYLSGEKKQGDCDDFSVLFATLLQAAGFQTAFVTEPGHIFIMFDTQIPENRIHTIPLPAAYFIQRNGTLWIPIETTLIPKANFIDAWTHCLVKFRDSTDNALQIFEIASSQTIYPPVSAGLLPTKQFAASDIPLLTRSTFDNDLYALDLEKQNHYAAIQNSLLDESATLEDRVRFATILGRNGNYTEAAKQYQAVLAEQSDFSAALNNWGNVEFILGHFNKADSLYTATVAHNPYSRGTYLNLAILNQVRKIVCSADSMQFFQIRSENFMLKAAQLLEGDETEAFALLGFDEVPSIGKGDDSYIEKIKSVIKKVKKYVDESFKKYKKKKNTRKVALELHGTKGTSEIADDRSELLYWSY